MLQANDNTIESLDGVTNLPRLQELFLCNNRILPSGCLSDSRQYEVPRQEGTDSTQGGVPLDMERGLWLSKLRREGSLELYEAIIDLYW